MLTPQRRDVDEVTVERRLNGDTGVRLNIGERELAVRLLNEQGVSDPQIATRLGISLNAAFRIRTRLGLEPITADDLERAGRS